MTDTIHAIEAIEANDVIHMIASVPEGSVHGERANFGGLVLGCIEADFCNQILILQHFSRSTK